MLVRSRRDIGTSQRARRQRNGGKWYRDADVLLRSLLKELRNNCHLLGSNSGDGGDLPEVLGIYGSVSKSRQSGKISLVTLNKDVE